MSRVPETEKKDVYKDPKMFAHIANRWLSFCIHPTRHFEASFCEPVLSGKFVGYWQLTRGQFHRYLDYIELSEEAVMRAKGLLPPSSPNQEIIDIYNEWRSEP